MKPRGIRYTFLSILLILSCVLVTTASAAYYGSEGYQDAPPSGPSIDASHVLWGKAKIDTIYKNTVRLTPDQLSQQGSIWSDKRLDLKEPFKEEVSLYLGHADQKTGDHSDGIAFVLHNDTRGTSAAGEYGAGLGVYGEGFITNSIAIEFDTYYNGDSLWPSTDPKPVGGNDGHCAFVVPNTRTGISDHKNTQWFSVTDKWVPLIVEWKPRWNGTILGGELSYKFGGMESTSSYTIENVENVFGGTEVLWGFSAATGAWHSALNSVAFVQMPAVFYTVTFESNGGSPTLASQSVLSGGLATAPAAITRQGYSFEGWYPTSDLSGNPWNFAVDTVTGDMTLYAKWKADKKLGWMVEYYRDSVSAGNIVGRAGMPPVVYGTTVELTRDQLDVCKPKDYQAGVQVGGPVAITTEGQTIQVLYQKP